MESQIQSTSFPQELEGEEGLISTRDGTIWYINYTENSTIRLQGNHSHLGNITGALLVPPSVLDTSGGGHSVEVPLVLSCSTDSKIMLKECDTLDLKCEFQIP